mmetsp:Transcript_3061/g.8869  ORF Transcript_3061/g.8869 Transcript_3061/m.8869 type:complete len:334 (-) Transcript_3061:748-1749(-)
MWHKALIAPLATCVSTLTLVRRSRTMQPSTRRNSAMIGTAVVRKCAASRMESLSFEQAPWNVILFGASTVPLVAGMVRLTQRLSMVFVALPTPCSNRRSTSTASVPPIRTSPVAAEGTCALLLTLGLRSGRPFYPRRRSARNMRPSPMSSSCSSSRPSGVPLACSTIGRRACTLTITRTPDVIRELAMAPVRVLIGNGKKRLWSTLSGARLVFGAPSHMEPRSSSTTQPISRPLRARTGPTPTVLVGICALSGISVASSEHGPQPSRMTMTTIRPSASCRSRRCSQISCLLRPSCSIQFKPNPRNRHMCIRRWERTTPRVLGTRQQQETWRSF